MKTISVIAILAIFCTEGFGQTLKQKEIVKAVTIWSENTYKLNGGARASVGGTSRKVIPITLPANTVEWYYCITTASDGATMSDKLNLAMQIGTAIAATTTTVGKVAAFTGLDQTIINAFKLPTGSMPVNTYILNEENANKFLSKEAFNYNFSNENLLQGTSRLNNILTNSGTWYIAIQNPSTWSALNFKIEVVAITVEKKWVVE